MDGPSIIVFMRAVSASASIKTGNYSEFPNSSKDQSVRRSAGDTAAGRRLLSLPRLRDAGSRTNQ